MAQHIVYFGDYVSHVCKEMYTTVYMYKVVYMSIRLRWWIVLFRYSVSLTFLSSLSTRWWKMHAEISL